MAGEDGPDDSDDLDDRAAGRRDDADASERGRRGAGERGRKRESDDGLRFWLPPIRLPETTFPTDLSISLPAPGQANRTSRSARSVVAVTLAFDLLDAWLVLAGVGPILDWTRIAVGLGLVATLTGIYGSLYAWEAVALAAGVGWATAVPSATLLLLVRGRAASIPE